MFLVPLSGDKIETSAGAVYTVLSYTNYQAAPAVYVEGADAKPTAVPFDDIQKINGAPVKLTSGKIFDAAARSKNLPLPQKNDKVTFKSGTLKVTLLKLNEHGKLADGLLVVGENTESKEKITERLANAISIECANGDHIVIKTFKSQYRDYLGAGK